MYEFTYLLTSPEEGINCDSRARAWESGYLNYPYSTHNHTKKVNNLVQVTQKWPEGSSNSVLFYLPCDRLSLDPFIFSDSLVVSTEDSEVSGLRGEIRDVVKSVLQSGVSGLNLSSTTYSVHLILHTCCVLFYKIEILFILQNYHRR